MIEGKRAAILLVMCTGLLMTVSVSGFSQESENIGMNLDILKDYSYSWEFVDRMKNSRDWITANADGSGGWDTNIDIPSDENGYPVEIPFDPDGSGPISPQSVRTVLFRDVDYPAGTYTLIFEGTGIISLDFDASGVFSESDTKHDFTISSPSHGGLLLTIEESSASDPVRNIRVIMPGFRDNYETQIFHPVFLDRLEGMKVIRFMDWGEVNHSTAQVWEERTTPGHFSQALDNGVAIEHMIELSNTLGADPWICVPHLADDDYIRNLAILIKRDLDPSRKLYIEYSNELWNTHFSQSTYVQNQGLALGVTNDQYQAGLFYTAKRSAEIFSIVENVFGGTSRLVRVIASQSGNPWTGEQVLEGLADPGINQTQSNADVLAIAPYFGGSVADSIAANGDVNSISIDEILDLTELSLVGVNSQIAENNDVAELYNVDLVAYEGGQHLVASSYNVDNDTLTNKLIDANRSPRMGDLYLDMFRAWFSNGGDMFIAYNYVSGPSKWGSWGVLEYQDQPVSSAPKFGAIQQVLQGALNGVSGGGVNIYTDPPTGIRIGSN